MPYHSIDDPTKLRRVLEAVLLIERDLELPALLSHVIQEACSMTGARYGALGVLNDDKTALEEFVTFGIEPDQAAKIGPLPTGKGVLGLLIADPRPLRLAHLSDHPDSFGLDYTGTACREEHHEHCPAWWGRGHAGTRCACPCHQPDQHPG